jgi:hypothetical protein
VRPIIIALVLVFFSFSVGAQDTPKRPSQDEMKQMMENSMGAMAPMLGKMTDAAIEAELVAAEKPETARRIAAFKKNLYDELLRQGFSKERAFAIVLSTPLPSAGGAMK